MFLNLCFNALMTLDELHALEQKYNYCLYVGGYFPVINLEFFRKQLALLSNYCQKEFKVNKPKMKHFQHNCLNTWVFHRDTLCSYFILEGSPEADCLKSVLF